MVAKQMLARKGAWSQEHKQQVWMIEGLPAVLLYLCQEKAVFMQGRRTGTACYLYILPLSKEIKCE